jgi:L-type amino acid transporter 8
VFLVVLPIIEDPKLVGVDLAIIVAGIPVYLFFIKWKSKPLWLHKIIHSWDLAVQKLFLAMPSQD